MGKRLIVALSGEICTGKTTLAEALKKNFDFEHFKTKDALKRALEGQKRIINRKSLQGLGEKLDKQTSGEWVTREFQNKGFDINKRYIIDAIRIKKQLDAFRKAYGNVIHIHLICSDKEELLKRYHAVYKDNKSSPEVNKEYKLAKSNDTEQRVVDLRHACDLIIDTKRSTPEDVLIRVVSFLGIFSNKDPLVDVIIGGQFGSEGKGQVCGYLAPEYDALVRVGGPNAGHSVFSDPIQKFHLLPSGTTRAPQAKLIIGAGAVLNLDTLFEEINKYKVVTDRLIIDENATIITQRDIGNETKLKKSIGSTGQGVGVATANNILNRSEKAKHKAKFFEKRLKGFLGSAVDELEKIYRQGGKVLLEGTQGTGLSLYHGEYPYVTSRDTTVAGCLAEAGIAPKRVRKIVLVTRTYPIRVQSPENGTSGHFRSEELNWAEISRRSGIDKNELEKSEKTTTTNRQRRVAEFSWYWFRKACELNLPTDIALTFVDQLNINNRKARRIEQLDENTIGLIEEIQRCAGAPVSLISTRFEYRSIIDRRSWKGNNG